MLPTFAKIFECAMSKRIYNFCEKFNILHESQHGFRKNRFTTLAIYKYIRKILEFLNDKRYAVGVLLDMSKAYDRVSHDILLNKLYNIGVRGTAHKWFVSYLKNRTQYVEMDYHNPHTDCIANIKSERAPVTRSIPQGSVIGCILFLIYINDLPDVLNTPSILFADDMSLLFPCTNEIDLNKKMHDSLTKIDCWLKYHNLILNYEKTKIMQFRPYQKRSLNINLLFQNTKIDTVDFLNF